MNKYTVAGIVLIILALLTIPFCDYDATGALIYITMGVLAIREGNRKARTHRNRKAA